MATATQKRKAAAKKGGKSKKGAAAKTSDNGAGKRAAQRETDKELVGQIKEMRADDKTHAEIAKKLHIQPTKALFLDIVGQVKASEKLRKDDVDGALVAKLRDEDGLAWHTISARVYASGDSLGVPAIKTMYQKETGKRPTGHVNSENGKAAKKGKAKKKSAARRKRGGRGNS